MSRLAVLFQRVEKARTSDFGGTDPDQYVELGPLSDGEPQPYYIGAILRHLTDEDKTARGLSLSQDAISLEMPFTPTLGNLSNRNYVAFFNSEYWNVLSIDKGNFANRKIRVIVGRNAE